MIPSLHHRALDWPSYEDEGRKAAWEEILCFTGCDEWCVWCGVISSNVNKPETGQARWVSECWVCPSSRARKVGTGFAFSRGRSISGIMRSSWALHHYLSIGKPGPGGGEGDISLSWDSVQFRTEQYNYQIYKCLNICSGLSSLQHCGLYLSHDRSFTPSLVA